MRRFFLILTLVIFICGCSQVKKEIEQADVTTRVEENVERINKTNDSTDKVAARAIINELDYAYTTALMNNMGDYPKLEDIKRVFSMDNVSWESDKIVYNNGFECSIKIENSMLSIKCLDIESKEYRIN